MDYVSDSDNEKLPPLTSEAVDTELLREVYSFFSPTTRAQILEEAQSSPFISIYRHLDSSLAPPDSTIERTEETPGLEDEAPKRSSITSEMHNSSVETMERQTDAEEPQECVEIPARAPPPDTTMLHNGQSERNGPETPLITNQDSTPARTSRSLRKRTFSSRHPYIADQADWLGICTVDSINEMFSENDDITQVCKALNQLYLQRRKRFPDEDRYRSKNFYAHLGNSRLLGIQGDVDGNQKDTEKHTQELDYNSDADPSEPTDNEEDIIPYDGFEIPESQYDTTQNAHRDDSNILRTIDYGVDLDNSSEPHSPGAHEGLPHDVGTYESEDSEPSEAEEQLIRVGGRYRKLSTILRGVLPESAWRLADFQKTVPRKKRKSVKDVPARKGLAIRKLGNTSHVSSELEKELSSLAEKDDEPNRSPSPQQTTLRFDVDVKRPTFGVSKDEDTLPKLPLLRSNSSFGYKSETPEPITISISSESDIDSDIEVIRPERLSAITPGRRQEALPLARLDYGDDEVQEADTIDRLLSSRQLSAHKKGSSSRMRKAGGPKSSRIREPRMYQSHFGDGGVVSGRSSKPQLMRPLRNTRDKATKRRQTGGTFSERPWVKAFLSEKNKHTENQRNKPESKKSKHEEFAVQGQSHLSRRNPVISTAVYEVEESEMPVKRSESPAKSTNAQLIVPSAESLRSDRSLLSLIGTVDIVRADAIEGGQIFFHGEDSVSFTFLEKEFRFAQFSPQDSAKNLVKFLAFCRRSLATDSSPQTIDQMSEALKNVIRWLLISKERPSEQAWYQLRLTMEHFSKLQTKDVLRLQNSLHSQLIYIYWIFVKLEVTLERTINMQNALVIKEKLSQDLDKYTVDFWITIFQTFTGDEFTQYGGKPDSFTPILLIQAIYRNDLERWWTPISDALEMVLEIGNLNSNLFNIFLAVASMAPRRSWAPVLVILSRVKLHNHSSGLNYVIDLCTLLKRRLSWPLDDKVLLQLYAVFAGRKFANFRDETEVPCSLGFVRTRSDIPESTSFERFMGLTYEYLSDMVSIKEAKKVISKLLATSQYEYQRGKRSQIMFVNRINLIVLFSQISDVDMGNQYLNLLEQVKESKDAFVYDRALDALQVLCEVSKSKNKPIPLRAFRLFFDIFNSATNLPGLHPLYKRFLSHIGFVFQGVAPGTKSGVLELIGLLGGLNLSSIQDEFKLDLLGITFLSTQELSSALITELTDQQRRVLTDFNDNLLKFFSTQMSRLPIAPEKADQFLEELIEFSLEIWILTSKLLGVSHWNIMMLQKYSYVGNSISRNRFMMFFCVEYLNHCSTDSASLLEIDKILLLGLLSPQLSKYALELYTQLSKYQHSIFCLKSIQEINSVFALQTYRLQIISRIISNVVDSNAINVHERDALILSFIKRLHETYSQHFQDRAYADMGKRIIEQVARSAQSSVSESDDFWELSARLGLPGKWTHDNWRRGDDTERVYLLNREFLLSLAGQGDAYLSAIENWINIDNNQVLYGLIQVYCSALSQSGSYWGHVALLLTSLLHILKRFKIAIRDSAFSEFLATLVKLATISSLKESKNLYYEILALETCVEILKETFLLYDGYMDRAEVVDLVQQFVFGYRSRPQKNYKIEVTFTEITMDKIRRYSCIYRPKPEDISGNHTLAVQKMDTVVESLAKINEQETPELESFSFSF